MMKKLIKPAKLQVGDKVATVSLSSGCAGEYPIIERFNLGLERLKTEFDLTGVPMSNSLKGIDYLNKNPKARAEDLMEAFEDKNIKAIIANIGGEESIRILPYLDMDIIRNNPKIFMGYSDSTTTHLICFKNGISSFYGPSILTDFAENIEMFDYTKKAVKKVLFSSDSIGEIFPAEYWTSEKLEWGDERFNSIPRKMHKNFEYEVLQGSGKCRGRLLGGCLNVLDRLRGTSLFPTIDEWENAILFIETSENIPSPTYFRYWIRSFASMGILEKINGIIMGKPYDECYYNEYQTELKKVIGNEMNRKDLPIMMNMSIGHTAPMCILPYGTECELDCNKSKFSILESGVI